MNFERQFRLRFLALFCFIGFLNIFLVSLLYFFEGKNSLISRASSQLSSICDLYQKNFSLILERSPHLISANQIFKMGHSGEVYLVNSNFQIQSASRFGNQWSTAVVKNEATRQSFQGKSGLAFVKDYRNVEVISAYRSVTFKDRPYALLCEIDMDEILEPLYETRKKVIALTTILILLTLLVGLISSNKLIQLLRRMKEKISHFNLKIIEAQELERLKIAHDVHDGIGQLITAIKWRLCSIEETGTELKEAELKQLIALCDKTQLEIKTISENETLSALKEFGVFAAFEELKNINHKLKGPVLSDSIPLDIKNFKFSRGFELNLYRILQELLQNAIRHSKANEIKITFSKRNEILELLYEDDGKGMSQDIFPPKSLSYRVNLFHGTLNQLTVKSGLTLLITFKLTDIKA